MQTMKILSTTHRVRGAARLPVLASLLWAWIPMLATAADTDAGNVTPQSVGDEQFDALGEEATGPVCAVACHGWDMIFGGPRRTPADWDSLIDDMVGRGAEASDAQLDLIARYLKWSWGLVWINTASAGDLVAVLDLPEDQAEAIVAFRKANGKFADLASLEKVPGVDAAAIDDQADAIKFN